MDGCSYAASRLLICSSRFRFPGRKGYVKDKNKRLVRYRGAALTIDAFRGLPLLSGCRLANEKLVSVGTGLVLFQ